MYIREAHPSDGKWPIPNAPSDPKTLDERMGVASTCVKEMKLSIPFVVDDVDDSANEAYSGWPDRIFIVGADGKIAYAGARGPFGFKPADARAALAKLLGVEDAPKKAAEKGD